MTTRDMFFEYCDDDGWPTGVKVALAVPVDLLDLVAYHIEEEPGRYNQSEWCNSFDDHDFSCSTAYCIGGWAAVLAGVTVHQDGWPKLNYERLALDMQLLTARLLNLTERAAGALVSQAWRPRPGLSVPEALRELQRVSDSRDGEPLVHRDVIAVSLWPNDYRCGCEDCASGDTTWLTDAAEGS